MDQLHQEVRPLAAFLGVLTVFLAPLGYIAAGIDGLSVAVAMVVATGLLVGTLMAVDNYL